MFADWQVMNYNCCVCSLIKHELHEAKGHWENIQICGLHSLLKGRVKMYVDSGTQISCKGFKNLY